MADEIDSVIRELRVSGVRVSRRDVLRAAAAGTLATFLASCVGGGPSVKSAAPTAAGSPRKGGRLVFATKVDAPNLDPHNEISDARMRRSMLTYDTLVEWNDDLTIRPSLAESYDTAGTKWVFRLRKGATFSNGKDVTADDVVYTFDKVLAGPGKGLYGPIKSFKATDKTTVEIELNFEAAPLLALLGGRYPYVIPRDGDKQVDLKQTAIGSGPFTVKEFVQNQRLVLQKNPNSWQAEKVLVDEVVIQIVPDEANIVAGLRSKDIDLTIFEDPKNFLLIKDDPNIVTARTKALRWDILNFPIDTPPYNNLKVRQAISLGLDREAIMSAAISGLGTLLGGYSPALWGAMPQDQNPFFKRDVGRAKQLLQESGVPQPLRIVIKSIVGFSALNGAAQVIAENLKEIGISAEIQPIDLGIWINDLNGLKHKDLTMNSFGGWVDPDIIYFNNNRKAPVGKDFFRWNDEETSTLLDKGRATLDQKEREKIYLDLQKLIATKVLMIPLYSPDLVTAQSKRLQNFGPHPTGYYHNLRYVWLSG